MGERRVRIVPGDKVEIARSWGEWDTVVVEDVWPEVGIVAINGQGFPVVYPWANMRFASVHRRLGPAGQKEWDEERKAARDG